MVYGQGSVQLHLTVGHDLTLKGNDVPRSSSSTASGWDWGWNEFGREMSEFGYEMSEFGRDLSRDITPPSRYPQKHRSHVLTDRDQP